MEVNQSSKENYKRTVTAEDQQIILDMVNIKTYLPPSTVLVHDTVDVGKYDIVDRGEPIIVGSVQANCHRRGSTNHRGYGKYC